MSNIFTKLFKNKTENSKPSRKIGLKFTGGGSVLSFVLGGSEIQGTNDLYYKLYRKNTDIK